MDINSEYDNYWTQSKQDNPNPKQDNPKQDNPKQDKPKKKKISFDDILTNMNLVVNKTGVLQYMTPYEQEEYDKHMVREEPLDKHSFIYNKYFKDYRDVVKEVPEVKIPKTKEEYLQMLIENRIRQIEERKRISKIKSTKMMFTNNTGADNHKNIQASINSLGNMRFF
jgi:hypothetical protein